MTEPLNANTLFNHAATESIWNGRPVPASEQTVGTAAMVSMLIRFSGTSAQKGHM